VGGVASPKGSNRRRVTEGFKSAWSSPGGPEASVLAYNTAMPVRMELSRILIRETSDTHTVELREAEGDRLFKIVIGINEAAAIERRLTGDKPPRPQTHELLGDVIEAMGGQIEQIYINDLRHDEYGRGTFYARLKIKQGDETLDVDSRPSDALALGVGSDTPIYVSEHVLDEVGETE